MNPARSMPRTQTPPRRRSEAARLRKIRALLGLSQREMARHFGVAHGAIGLWESGARTIPGPALTLMRLYETELAVQNGGGKKPITKLRTSLWSRSWKLSATGARVTTRLCSD